MATSATIRCGDRRFFTYSDGYVSGLGRALSSACNDKQNEGFETLEQFADYLTHGFNSDYGFKIEEGDGPGGEYEYTIEMTGPGGYWVSVYDQYKKERHDDSEEDYFWASTRKSKNVKKEGRGKKCVNYLGMPVCPECGSPNLVEGKKDGDDTNCVCSRCYAKCWFNESDFDTGYGADHLRYRNGEVPESFVKSFSGMVKAQRDKNIRKATPTDMRDAEIFGQIAGLLEQLSVKNRKNLGDLLATYSFGHTRPEDIVNVFNKARSIIENGEEQWW